MNLLKDEQFKDLKRRENEWMSRMEEKDKQILLLRGEVQKQREISVEHSTQNKKQVLDHQKEVYNLTNEAKSLSLIITDLKMKK